VIDGTNTLNQMDNGVSLVNYNIDLHRLHLVDSLRRVFIAMSTSVNSVDPRSRRLLLLRRRL